MIRPERLAMTVNADLIAEFASLWFQAPMVMSSRMKELAASPMAGGVELNRMITEKLAAALESVMAVNVAMVAEGVTATAALATGTCTGMVGAAERVAVAALKPYGKRVRANARRLSE